MLTLASNVASKTPTVEDIVMNTVTLTPEIQKASSYFRKVTDTKSPHHGKKREDLFWEYAGFVPDSPEAKAINHAIETHGRKELVANVNDWSYSPTPENCNLTELVKRLDAERGGWSRVVTKETLDAAGSYYFAASIRLLGKDQAAATAGSKVIREKLKGISGNKTACAAMLQNIEAMITAVGESEDSEELEAFSPHMEVFDRLIVMIQECIDAPSTEADAL